MSTTEALNIQKLGILAGGGDLPRQLVEYCQRNNINYCIAGIHNHVDTVQPDCVYPIGHASKILRFFKNQNVTDIVFIGSVKRPTLWSLWPDWKTLKFFVSAWLRSLGDDGLLKALRNVLEDEGFQVHGIHKFLPGLLMPEGILGTVKPDQILQGDIQLGLKASQLLGKSDIGQAVIVKNGQIIAREDKHGTNVMIEKYGAAGAILVKTCKPQQDRDLDLPTLGLKTVETCARKKMIGIVGQAGQTLLVDRDEAVALADKNNIFLMGVSLND
jgi:hypothetical protein